MSEKKPENENVREALRAACRTNEVVRLLRDDPQAFAKRFNLSDAERERLERSDLLLVLPGEVLAGTTTPITITDC
ncbi:hypothetical protein [Streptomyces sp. ALI-76-A]|uniref:hypothetical protein n=1 Tax=Streptomyces sp. ALI-76-A TaxID=3025736 RepID=UPI00256F1DD9|nr:hypothetical protein [Streptomyces sp. ALI-76-A]MDL5205335.1 hypothetical protein [Streptomyces sp. ALI-76-A]